MYVTILVKINHCLIRDNLEVKKRTGHFEPDLWFVSDEYFGMLQKKNTPEINDTLLTIVQSN